MALQDGLLSFQIKETFFLSSDKPAIAELKELELLPDVEILENAREISITGCLQLNGTYEPARQNNRETDEEQDTLVAAMKFTPFQFEENGSSYAYESDEVIAHRIPLNISIPIHRVTSISEIYAVVDSFDYQLVSPRQLQLEAVLKIAGLELQEQETASGHQSPWQFAHVAAEAESSAEESISLEEIEQKLAALEEQIEQQERAIAAESRWFPQQEPSTLKHEETAEWQADNNDTTEEEPPHIAPVSYQERDDEGAGYGDLSTDPSYPRYQPAAAQEETWEEPRDEAAESVAHQAAHQDEEAAVLSKQDSQETVDHADVAEVNAQPEEADVWLQEEVAYEPAEESQPAASTEMKVAIGSKRQEEQEATVNITSIFSNAKRHQTAADTVEAAAAPESSQAESASERKRPDAFSNLTSVVRHTEERFSKLRICIIQRNETIESIASRYSVSPSKILEVNNLTEDRISEGQVLYIPQ